MSPERVDTRADERVDVVCERRMIRVMDGGTPHGYDRLEEIAGEVIDRLTHQ